MSESGGIGVYCAGDVGANSIERAQKLLVAFPDGVKKAVNSALKKASVSGQSYAAKAISNSYVLKSADFKKYSTANRKYITQNGVTSINIVFKGKRIPLSRFAVSVNANGSVSAHVKKESGAKILTHAFWATVGDGQHVGVFERETKKRLPIKEKFGPSIPEMMNANAQVKEDVSGKIKEAFDKNIDHEILAVMNGWRA